MGVDGTRLARGRAGRRRGAAGLLAAGLLLSGCASMPDNGPVQRVESSARAAEGEPQVLVDAVPPQDGLSAQQIVSGFLEAVTSDDVRFETARQYLTPRLAESWDPFAGTTVLEAGLSLATAPGEEGRVNLSGTLLASVDSSHVYAPAEGPYEEAFRLRRVEGEWRIDDAPDGLVMAEADFRRNYRSAGTYYYADLGGQRAAGVDGKVLVPDPVHVRRRIDPIRETLQALLDGPSEWYDPVVITAVPGGVTLADGRAPGIDDSGVLSVWLEGMPADYPDQGCERMAAQVQHTVQNLTSAGVSETRLLSADGTRLCTLDQAGAEANAPGLLDGRLDRSYFIDEDGRLVSVTGEDADPRPVSGPLGSGDVPLRGAAVSRDRARAAAVSADGGELYVAALSASGDPEPEAAVTSEADGEDQGLSAPSWDGLGDLWVADRDPRHPRLLRLDGGEGPVEEVPVSGLAEGERIEALRLAADGVRVALLVSDGEATTLRLGRVERSGAEEDEPVTVRVPPTVVPRLDHVVAASWAGGSRLVVVGRPEDGVEQLQYVVTDGSPSNVQAVPGLPSVAGIAAAEDESQPLVVAQADEVIARLQDGQWKVVTTSGSGTAPVYPG
ncbi:LpqB family beta-propeller domain-containing protein [Streptomyces sp. DSM 44917]|uniref:LpqB family beta-propeller domain-containing protein n=1 Tax=Streptomyces boetiae TaxID=3075541 RepID=A0ABU2LEN9_9ACTN|nr:LpqB family beta-propeller domain-containing protein [Streptomyces sp. DSM 44917]MDT0309987.1 LpqB family beta-propeller domain-containing protein [Streptomyces sp. DSM 44917]